MTAQSFTMQLRYILKKRRVKSLGCPFCLPLASEERMVNEAREHMRIMSNGFPYARWDDQKVAEHLLVLPNRHVRSLAELTADESLELMSIISQYESSGYSFYLRAPANRFRSVEHLHGHLISFAGQDVVQ